MTTKHPAGKIPTVEVTLRDGSVHLIRKHVGPVPRHAYSWAMQQLPYGTDFRGATFRKLYT